MFRVLRVAMAMFVIVGSFGVYSGRAYAHERRMVGPYQFVVGWLTEPAYVGAVNGLDLRVSDTRQNPAAPVSGLEKTLTADVAAGGLAPFKLEVTARFGTAGAYNGVVMPTVKGTYTFHVTGKIDQTNVDERFTSGPSTFGDIEDTAAVQYPAKVPVGDDLGKRLDAIQSGVDQARVFAIVALVLGLAGLITAAYASRRAR